MAACSREPFAVGSMEDYEETGDLGKGTYGSVVKARHHATGQEVAIKRLGSPDHQGRSGVLREKWFLEACSGIPNVVGFNGLVQQPGTTELCLVMECVSPSLRNFFQQRRDDDSPQLPESTVCSIMWQLLSAAKKMQERHIMHRDLKPENILVNIDQDIVVKICDFGLALHMSDAPPYASVGSKWYMAPEMLLGKTDYDALVDTWSLGCVMAELIDGDLLFHGTNREDQLCAIINVLGIPDYRKWPWFYSSPLATRLKSKLLYAPRRNDLRERFTETMLSEQGFEVLNGLLTWNPDKRLTARAALKLPWFAHHRAPEPAREEDLTSVMPKMEDR